MLKSSPKIWSKTVSNLNPQKSKPKNQSENPKPWISNQKPKPQKDEDDFNILGL